MSTLFALRGLLFAGELLAGSTVIMALGWLAPRQKSASARHLTWSGAFVATLALPVFAALVPSAIRILLPAPEPIPHLVDVASIVPALPAPSAPVTAGLDLDASAIAMVLAGVSLAGFLLFSMRIAAAAIG